MTATLSPTPQRLAGAGLELQVYDYGNSEAPPMVLIHGMQDLALGLEPLAAAFRDRYHVVAYDQRGHGDSDQPGVYALPHFVADLHAVIAQLRLERPILVGHSLGGQVACNYAAVFPEVPSAVVNIDGIGPPFDLRKIPAETKQWRLANGIASLLRAGGHKRPLGDLEDAFHLFCRFHPKLDPEHARRLVEIGTRAHPHGGLQWKWDPHVETAGLTMSPEISEERWAWIECPVLVATADDSAAFYRGRAGFDAEIREDPDEIARRVALFRNATHVEIENAGHMIHYDNPARLVEVIERFLAAL
jgi:pimeloyl-ACP methyl ester carboxylesterase